MKIATVSNIGPTGEEGMYKATIDLYLKNTNYHMSAITVIGVDLTECIERAVKILSAFNS